MGWGARSMTGVKVCTVNVALHEEMLREPAVGMCAEKLKEALHRIETGDFLDAHFGRSRNH